MISLHIGSLLSSWMSCTIRPLGHRVLSGSRCTLHYIGVVQWMPLQPFVHIPVQNLYACYINSKSYGSAT
ncbi:hypothetical protein Scep_020796 [Stephania cephalantha]|uniref:Uncharacterized protein n=1 Tax=Stephania cephalantha TaxID=152367 RepID=A0AAP0IDJ9_9MAGN